MAHGILTEAFRVHTLPNMASDLCQGGRGFEMKVSHDLSLCEVSLGLPDDEVELRENKSELSLLCRFL